MKNIFLILLVLVVLGSNLIAQNLDKDEIMNVIQTSYVEGLQNEGNIEKIDKGFHPGFEMIIPELGGEVTKYPIYKWKQATLKKLKDGRLPRSGDKIISIKFLNIDIVETAAVAKFEFYVGSELAFVDFMSLYKFEDGWKIISKIYYQYPKK